MRDEAALDQQTMAICLREIRRCRATGVRPNFIALLGDRYGWQPLPPTILAAEFDALRPYIPAGDTSAQAAQWYRLDENAVPQEYCLQPRTGEFIEPSAWNPVEQSLLQALAGQYSREEPSLSKGAPLADSPKAACPRPFKFEPLTLSVEPCTFG